MVKEKDNINKTRRIFLKISALSMLLLSARTSIMGNNKNVDNVPAFTSKPFEEMLPVEILQAIKKMPFAFIPISPMIEWHSFHLPMGTDGLISEAVCRGISEETGGVWLRPLSLGLDSWRSNKEKKMWGFKSEEEVFGMNFPNIPLTNEYCSTNEMKAAVKNRVEALRGIGIKHIFLLNHHGGKGQIPTIEELGKELSDSEFVVHGLKTYQFNDLTEEDGFYGVGGHAGFSETTWLLGFRPDLVDLNQLHEGELSVRDMGILHNKPIIEEKWNPRNTSVSVADKLKERVIANFRAYINGLG